MFTIFSKFKKHIRNHHPDQIAFPGAHLLGRPVRNVSHLRGRFQNPLPRFRFETALVRQRVTDGRLVHPQFRGDGLQGHFHDR